MARQKTQTLRTLDQLREAIVQLVDGFRAETFAQKHVVTKHGHNHRSVSEFYSGELRWWLPKQHGGLLLIHEHADTLDDVLLKVQGSLKRELEERGRARRIERGVGDRQALQAPPLKRLEYQP